MRNLTWTWRGSFYRRLAGRVEGAGRLLAREVLVHGELVNVRCTRSADGGHRGSDAFCRESVEVLARLPEVERAKTALYRTGRVKDESIRRIAFRVDRPIELVHLLGSAARREKG